MKVIVVFDFPHIINPDSEEATEVVDVISDYTREWSADLQCHAYVDDAQGETNDA